MSIQSYQRAVAQAESPRELEYRAFAQATAALQRLQAEDAPSLTLRAEAIGANRRLWALLSADCMAEGNALPPEVRAQIISIALWVSRYSTEALVEGASVEPLIDVNRMMMDGLAGA